MRNNIIRRIFLICSIFLSFNTLSWSIGAYPYPITVTQPDGSQITIKLHGDEWYNWTTSTDGYRLIKNSKGIFEYAQLKSGSLVASGVKASNAGARTSSETGFVQTLSKTLSTSDLKNASIKRSVAQQAIQKAIASRVNKAQTGTFKLLVVLANFSDTQSSYDTEDFDALLNTNVGSFHDYYLENSNGSLNVVSTVTAWVTLPNTHDYYGPEDKWGEFAYEAIKAAYTAGVDMSQFDNDGDGVIDGVSIYHQGNGQEATDDKTDIWSHAWSLTSAGYSQSARTFGSVVADGYFTQPELLEGGSDLTTIGVICHEFGHILGALDFYDTDYKVNGQYDGTGDWDLMASGAYNGSPSGSSPAHHNPYTKIAYGWITPQVLSTVQSVKLPPVLTSQQVLRVNTATENEYFLLENRVQQGFDSNIPGVGMLIYHVDDNYITQHADSNNVNAYAHQGLYIKKASVNDTIDSPAAPFPGSTLNTDFTDITTPSSLSWSGDITNQSITKIAYINDTIRFDFMALQDGVPTSFTGTLENDSAVLLNWVKAKENYPVLIAFSTNNTFGTPVDGHIYAPGDNIDGGGKVVYYGGDVQSFLHQNDTPERVFYYRIWSNKKQVSYTSYLSTSVNGLTTINFNVTDLYSQALAGAEISLNGEQIQTKSDGTASVRGVYPDGVAYAYSSHLEGYEDKWGAFLSADSVLLDIQMIPVDTTVIAFTNTTVNGNSIGLSWNPVVSDNFSGYEPFSTTIPNWTMVDKDKLSTYGAEDFDFPNENYTGSFIVFDGYDDGLIADGVAISSYADRQVLACMAAAPTSDNTSPKNDDWLISPQIEVTDTMWVSFMARSVTDTWGLERIRVLVSDGETTTSSFTSISPGTYMKVPTSWTFYKYNLTGYKGQTLRFAINCVSADAFMLLLDCIKISRTEPFKPGTQSLKSASVESTLPTFKRTVASGVVSSSNSKSYKKSSSITPGTVVYTISRNGDVIDEVTDLSDAYTDQVDNCGEYVYQISANKADATNDYVLATSTENKVANCVSKADVSIDYTTGIITVQLPDGQSSADYDIFNMAGERVLIGTSEHYRFTINGSSWTNGIYLLHLRYLQGDEAVKILMK